MVSLRNGVAPPQVKHRRTVLLEILPPVSVCVDFSAAWDAAGINSATPREVSRANFFTAFPFRVSLRKLARFSWSPRCFNLKAHVVVYAPTLLPGGLPFSAYRNEKQAKKFKFSTRRNLESPPVWPAGSVRGQGASLASTPPLKRSKRGVPDARCSGLTLVSDLLASTERLDQGITPRPASW